MFILKTKKKCFWILRGVVCTLFGFFTRIWQMLEDWKTDPLLEGRQLFTCLILGVRESRVICPHPRSVWFYIDVPPETDPETALGACWIIYYNYLLIRHLAIFLTSYYFCTMKGSENNPSPIGWKSQSVLCWKLLWTEVMWPFSPTQICSASVKDNSEKITGL